MKKVLIIEDDRLLARHLKRTLESAEYEVYCAYHAPGAIDMIDDKKPDVILLDMLLGGSTAMPLLNELASHDDLASIPIIVLSSLGDDIDVDSLTPYGVREVLDKSAASPRDILAALGACLR